MAAPPLLTLQDVALTFGGTPLITRADLTIAPGERTCLVGRNGSGKSTLMKIAAGLVEPDRGRRFVQPGTTIRYLAQEPDFSGFATTLDFVEAGLPPGESTHRARYLLESLGLTGAEDPGTLSGGEGRRTALAQALAPEPDVLLLDEPTNHLDLPAIEWLEAELKGTRAALVLISHDRRFLSALSRATIWLDRGETRRIDQGFSGFEAWRDAFFEEEERDQHKLDRKIVAEEHWLRYGVTARRKRNVRRLGNLHELRQDRREVRRPVGSVSMQASDAESSGSLVVEARDIAKRYGDRTIVDGLSLRVMRGDRLGIVGANGAGKTTLINLLMGRLAPDSGQVVLGTNLLPVVLDQARAVLEPGMTVTDVLTGGRGDSVMVNGQSRHVIGYLKDFLFSPRAGAHAGLGAVRRRAQPAADRPGAGPAGQPAGARRADQRPRPGDPRPAAGDARRLPGHADPGEPRPRLPRPRGRQRAGVRRRRPLGRVCRRLQRHAGPARAGRRGAERRPESQGAAGADLRAGGRSRPESPSSASRTSTS